jgi:hypothetical protein
MSLRVPRSLVQRLCRTSRRWFVAGAALAAPFVQAFVALPRWGGELSGEAFPLGETGPGLHWTFSPGSAGGGVREIVFQANNAFTHLRVLARIDAATGDGTWRVETGRIEAGPWFSALAPTLGPEMSGAVAEGSVLITGSGDIHQGKPAGSLRVEWRDGAVRHAGRKWALEGIAFHAEADVAALPQAIVPMEITVRTVTNARLGARNVAVSAALASSGELSVTSARVEIAGGEITAAPFVASLFPLSLQNVKVQMMRVGLQDIVALVPAALADAHGRIDGEVRLGWSKADGLQIGEGRLSLRADEPTVIRLTPQPGFLTSHVPARFVFVPGLPPLLRRWFSPLNPAYESMRVIELGQTDLHVRSLEVKLTPEGDGGGRSAKVIVVAQPEQADNAVGKVTFEINVFGPLANVLVLGMKQHLSFGMH